METSFRLYLFWPLERPTARPFTIHGVRPGHGNLDLLDMMTRNVSRSAGVLLVLVYFGFVAGSYFIE
jgi:hypothetical protein